MPVIRSVLCELLMSGALCIHVSVRVLVAFPDRQIASLPDKESGGDEEEGSYGGALWMG